MNDNVISSYSAIYIKNLVTGQEYSKNQDISVEGSSTIKIAIVLLTLLKVKEEGLSLRSKLPIYPRHLSEGSGILNWVNKNNLSIKDYIFYIGRYSDCVASNVLVEFLGGKTKVNKILKDMNFKTTLDMDPMNFTNKETVMPKVSTTTAKEILNIFIMTLKIIEESKFSSKLIKSLSQIEHFWPSNYLDLSNLGNYKVLAKTGSITDIGKNKESILNVVGVIKLKNTNIGFSLMNKVSFKTDAIEEDEIEFKKYIMKNLSEKIEDIY